MTYNISIIIPWRSTFNQDRNDNAEWCFERYKALFPNAEIVYADSGDRIFSRGKSINKGVAECSGDYIIITDADYLFSPALARDLVNKQPWTVAVKSENYYFLNENITNKILKENPTTFDINKFDFGNNVLQSTYTMYGGVLAMPKKNFIPFDPRFAGYGYEDQASNVIMKTYYGKSFRTGNKMYHMFHRRNSDSLYMKKSYENKAYYEQVWKPIEFDKKAIRKLVESWKVKI